jgi:hypothetical protein
MACPVWNLDLSLPSRSEKGLRERCGMGTKNRSSLTGWIEYIMLI